MSCDPVSTVEGQVEVTPLLIIQGWLGAPLCTKIVGAGLNEHGNLVIKLSGACLPPGEGNLMVSETGHFCEECKRYHSATRELYR